MHLPSGASSQDWGRAGVERAGDAELADQQKIIVRRMLPIHLA
jgi:hypothetical protein